MRTPENTEGGPETSTSETRLAEKFKQYRKALSLVLNDAPTEPVDAIFLHPLSHGDDNEMFPLAAKLIKEDDARYVAINGSSGEKYAATWWIPIAALFNLPRTLGAKKSLWFTRRETRMAT